jgi:hypothetical protein
MLGEFLGRWVQLDRQGISDAEMEAELQAFMDGLSTKFEDDLARKASSVAYNQGRAAEVLSSNQVDFVIRSEVLDANTCQTCAGLDGAIVEVASDDFQALMPPALCEGGDRCRGFYIPVRNP